jgi:glycosyltransferase involved in cell wall biosynthesis
MSILDEHWIAYPRFIAGELQRMERLKLKYMQRPEVRFLDVILARPAPSGGEPRQSVLARVGVGVGEYVLVVPGGGTGHPGVKDAVGEFLEAGRALAGAGVSVVFVGRGGAMASGDAGAADGGRLRGLDSLSQSDLAELMRGAQLVLVNGGSTLLQAIACGKACIAAPIAGDQPERIRRCVSAGVALPAPLESQAMVRAAQELLGDDSRLNALAGRAIALGLADGVDVALRALSAWLGA